MSSIRMAGLLLALPLVVAAAAPRGPQVLPQGPPSDQGRQPTFRVRVDVVRTDVIVRDQQGRFVGDLKPGEFEVFEDGVRQAMMSVQLVKGGRVFTELTGAPEKVDEGLVLPPARPVPDTAGRILLFFVDDLHLSFGNTLGLRDLFRKISRDLVHEGDLFGVVSTGPSSLAIDLTYDRRRLDEAIGRISGGGLKPSEIINAPETSQGVAELRYRAHVAFATALDILKRLEGIKDRRKAVVYVSEGYDFNPFTEARFGDDPIFAAQAGEARQLAQEDRGDYLREGNPFSDADLVRELSELTRAANRANATFYTIDPRGLVGGPDLDETISPTDWQTYVRKAHDSLRVLAEETGGFAVVDQNDFDRALKRIDAETSDYYMLAYYPTNTDPTRRTRHIEVKVTRPGVTVWSRTAYTLAPAPGGK